MTPSTVLHSDSRKLPVNRAVVTPSTYGPVHRHPTHSNEQPSEQSHDLRERRSDVVGVMSAVQTTSECSRELVRVVRPREGVISPTTSRR